MPQIATAKMAAFLGWLVGSGVEVSHGKAHAAELRKTQSEIHADKVASMENAPVAVKMKPVIVSRDGYVLDGHHHWVYHALAGEKMNVAVIGLGIEELLDAAVSWAEGV